MRNTFGWEKPGISGKRTLIDTWDVGRLWLRRGIQNLIPSRCLLFVCWFINPSVYIYIIIIINNNNNNNNNNKNNNNNNNNNIYNI
jgi:hypothetical protein